MSDIAKELYGAGDHLVAPRLIVTEVANALARKTMQGVLAVHEARYHFNALRQFLPDLMEIDGLVESALENACVLRHPIYDLIYLEAARHLDVQLVTADRRFIAKLAGTDFARHVTLLSDWQTA
jgi:predicted nucleic acid-binding protein